MTLKHAMEKMLSQYIYSNYDKIDFSGFKELLDTINSIALKSF